MAAPVLLWFRRDLRLADHPALTAALATGRPVIPVFIHDAAEAALGAAPRFRLGLALAAFQTDLARIGARLVLRQGPAAAVLDRLIAETGAQGVVWSRLYDPQSVARDSAIKAALTARGLSAGSHPGHVLWEPPRVETGQGGAYQVFGAYWKAVRGRPVPGPLPPPGRWPSPVDWPASDSLAGWRMEAAMNRAAPLVAAHAMVGEAAARDRLAAFIADSLSDYATARDFPARAATSGLSEPLAWGEIAPATIWNAGLAAMERGDPGAEPFLRELAWRDFAHHLMFHRPGMLTGNLRADWDSFPWSHDADRPEILAFRQGRTGFALVDAGMREMWVTGRMHNRVRMVVASFLTKHLMTHWRVGQALFADMLTDWDPAANAMNWQWVAGSGADAAPFFRIFNPLTQAERFDPDGAYRRHWLAEGQARPGRDALAYYDAVPRHWRLDPADPAPPAIFAHAEGRARALAAWEAWRR